MANDDRKVDPLDPLESAYYEATEGPAEETTSDEEGDVFHGEAIEEAEPVEEIDEFSSPPPPPPSSPFSRILRILPFVGGLFILVLLVYLGYNFFNRGDAGPVELTYWILWEEEEVMQPLIEEYQGKNSNVTIKLVRQTPTQYRERLEAHIANGEGPDIFRFHNTWTPMLREELAPLPDDVMGRDEFGELFYPVMVEDLSVGEQLIGIPLMYDGLMVFYNRDILSAAGLDRPAPGWNEFLSQAEAMTVKDRTGRIQTAGAALGRADNVRHFSDILGLLLLQNGANPAMPDTEAGVGGLLFYRLFAQTPDNVWGPEFDNDILAFAGGRVGMIFAPSWEALTLRAANPNLNFGTAPVPQVEGSPNRISWASYWAEGVNSRSPNQKAAWEFIKFLSEKETLEKFYSLAAETRVFGEPYPRKDMNEQLAASDILSPLAQQAGIAQSFYMASRTFDNGINDRIIQYYENAVNSLDEGNSPQAALETASQGISQVLKSYNVRVE